MNRPVGPPYQVPKGRIRTQLPQELPFFRWMHEKEHPTNGAPSGHDYDGQAAIPLTRPDYITSVKRWGVVGLNKRGIPVVREDEEGPVYEALDADQSVATDEFWRVLRASAKTVD